MSLQSWLFGIFEFFGGVVVSSARIIRWFVLKLKLLITFMLEKYLLLLDIIKSIWFFVFPSGDDQVHILLSFFLNTVFKILKPFSCAKFTSLSPFLLLAFLPYTNGPKTVSSSGCRSPIWPLKSPITTRFL